MNINWKVRFKNPMFWVQIIVSTVVSILTYFGLTVQDLTSWDMVLTTAVQALQTPYVWIMTAVMWYNAIIDPTTTGVTDSANALTYTEPNNKK